MIKVAKNNRQLTIADDQLQRYIDLGYNEIDENGAVVQTGNPITLAEWKSYAQELEKETSEHIVHIRYLEGQLQQTEKQLAEFTKKPPKATKSSESTAEGK